METYYDLLDVKPTATTEEINGAYRRVSKAYHPDLGATGEKMKRLNEAHEILTDAVNRREYDADLARQNAGPTQSRTSNAQPRQERPPDFNPYANPQTAEEKAAYDRGTRVYWEANRPGAKSRTKSKPVKDKRQSWLRPKSPSLLVLDVACGAWYILFNQLAGGTGLYFFHLLAAPGTILFWPIVICAWVVPAKRAKQFWSWARRKVTGSSTKRANSANSTRPKVEATK